MYVIIVALLAIVFSLILRVSQKNTNAVCTSRKRLDGKTCVVTGGTAGMGLETAKEFARRGARVIIACPFQQEGFNAERIIIEETGNKNVVFKNLNLASLKSTREFAQDLLSTEERLDILVNNAGIGVVDKLTEDGLNVTMQINFYGHFLLTILLLPLLKKTGTPDSKSRIVGLSSIFHRLGKYDFGNMNKVGYWYFAQIYANSKYCLVLFATELTKRLKNSDVVINTVDPGAVGTQIYNRNFGRFGGFVLTMCCSFFFKTPWQGAQTAIHVSIDESIEGKSGEFFKNCALTRAMKSAYDLKAAKKLFEESQELVQLDEKTLSSAFL